MTSERGSGASGQDDPQDTSPISTLPKPDLDKYLVAIRKRKGDEWVERHRGLLDDQAAYIDTLSEGFGVFRLQGY